MVIHVEGTHEATSGGRRCTSSTLWAGEMTVVLYNCRTASTWGHDSLIWWSCGLSCFGWIADIVDDPS
jgi:hypothetical protein